MKTYRAKTTSPYRGVSWDSKNKKWRSQITHNKKVEYIGTFKTEREAGQAYDDRARKLGLNPYIKKLS